ncbi:hypothetical protein [Thiolapillus sp.]
MTTTIPQPVMVSLKGFGNIGRKSLAFLFSTQKRTTYEVVEEHPRAIHIIDADDYRGQAALENLQSANVGHKGPPVVVLGRELVAVHNGIALQKPFQPKQLLVAIETLAARMYESLEIDALPSVTASSPKHVCSEESVEDAENIRKAPNQVATRGLSQSAALSLNEREIHAHIGTTKDVNLDSPHAVTKVQYDPDQFLAQRMMELIKLADKEHKYIRASCCDVVFYIDSNQRCIRTLVKDKHLRTFGALPLDFKSFEYSMESELPAEIEAHRFRYSYESFVWRMVLASSRGRLPLNTDLDQLFVLRRWPNLTRLLLFPHATQISALWIASPKSIREVIRQLAIPQRYVFAFFAATRLMEYLTPVDSSTQPVVEVVPEQEHKSRGLFRRLLKTLYRKKGGA